MNIKNDNILIIGAGNMGYAFISALIENKVSPKKIYVIEKKILLIELILLIVLKFKYLHIYIIIIYQS